MPGKKLNDNWAHLSPAVAAAYGVCLDVEKELMRQQTPTLTAVEAKVLEKKLVNIRILGYLLEFGPTDTAREHAAKAVLVDKDGGSDAVTGRGGLYDQLFLRPFRKAEGFTPEVSHHSQSPIVVTLADVAKTVKIHPTNHSEAKKSALVRDNFRCMVTGIIDHHSSNEFEELWQPGSAPTQATQCTCIFVESMNVGVEDERKVYPENTWTIIRAFGYEDVYDELGGPNSNIHRLENVLTLTSTLQSCFDRLEFWFEATDTPNSYRVCSNVPQFHAKTGVPEHVVFTTEQQDLPLPSPRYLEIHATCCRIAHMSGAADYYRDLDDEDPFVTKFRSFDPVGSDFSAALQTRLLDLSERQAIVGSGSE